MSQCWHGPHQVARVGLVAVPAGVEASVNVRASAASWPRILESGKAARLSQPLSAAQTTGRPSSASIGCCTPLALCAPIFLLYTAHAYFIQFHPDTYTGHADVEETVTAAKLSTKLS